MSKSVELESKVPSLRHFDELFTSISADSIGALDALIIRLKNSSSNTRSEYVYNLLNTMHPQKRLTALQWSIEVYPKVSLVLIRELLEYGAGTEVALNLDDSELVSERVTPLWRAVELKHPVELIKLLLSFKCDVFFRSNCHPFVEDEKDPISPSINKINAYSLLHLAAKIGANEQVVLELIRASSGLLLKDQGNRLKETPLMLAVDSKCYEIVKLLIECEGINLDLKDSAGLSAYERAAKDHSVNLCRLLLSGSNDPDWYLEVIEQVPVDRHQVWRNCEGIELRDLGESDELLPIEGYWEWVDSDWLKCMEKDGIKCRLRQRVFIKEPQYLKEAIEYISKSPQTSLNVLFHGIQKEANQRHKLRAANYFQRLLKWIDKQECSLSKGGASTDSLGLIDNLSRSDLSIVRSDPEINDESTDKVQKISRIVDEFNSDSDDSLLFCPVCSHRFEHDRQSHLSRCLSRNTGNNKIAGGRYTAVSSSTNLNEECGICYEDLRVEGVVVLDCLCKFHEKCIEKWFKRGHRCPFHQNE